VIHLVYGNRIEALAELLARDLAARSDPLEPTLLLLGGGVVDWWVRLSLAKTNGIAAHLTTRGLHAFVAERARVTGRGVLLDRARLEAALLLWLGHPEHLRGAVYEPLRQYLDAAGEKPDARDRRRARMAWDLAALFFTYGQERPDELGQWAKANGDVADSTSPHEGWQRQLWSDLVGAGGFLGPGVRDPGSGLPYLTWPMLVQDEDLAQLAPGLPLHWLAPNALSAAEQRVAAALAHAGTLRAYVLNPSREFWEDAPARKRRGKDPRQLALLLPAPASAEASHREDEEPLALSLWGNEARRRVRFFSQLAEGDFVDAFASPAEPWSRLAALHGSLLRRSPRVPPSWKASPGDSSLEILACPNRRRTAETVAADIWARLLASPAANPLGFRDVAVFAAGPDAEAWLGLLSSTFASIFEESRRLPVCVVDRALAAESPLVEAVDLLLSLPAGRLSRRDVLRTLSHPNVRVKMGLGTPDELNALALHIGVVRARDEDLTGELPAEDPAAWQDGLWRLALGRVSEGATTLLGGSRTDQAPIAEPGLGAGLAPPLPVGTSWQERADALALTMRALLSDAVTLRRARWPLAQWATAFRRLIDTYCAVQEPGDETARLRLYEMLAGWSVLVPRPELLGYQAARELFRLQGGRLTTNRGTPLTGGVTVAPLGAARHVPFRLIYVVGLDEADFPGSSRRHHLDARPVGETARAPSQRERDQGLFLDTLLAARDALVSTYQDRDEKTGERLRPSPLIDELGEVACALGLVEDKDALLRRVPLWRHEDRACRLVFSSAEAELAAQQLARPARRSPDAAAATASVPAPRDAIASHPEAPVPVSTAPAAGGSLSLSRPARPSALVKKIRLTQLRDFLRCPLQGSARAVLGLAQPEDDSEELHRQDDVLDPERAVHASLLRSAFWHAWQASAGHGTDLLASVYDDALTTLSRTGQYPAGLFASARRQADLDRLQGWARGLSQLSPAVLAPLPTLRFGRGLAVARTKSAPPLRWSIAAGPPGESLEVELHGTFLPRVAVAALPGGDQADERLAGLPRGEGSEAAVQLVRKPLAASQFPSARDERVLEALLQHVVRAASAREPSDRAGVAIIDPTPDSRPTFVRFKAVAPEAARAYLATLSSELLNHTHDYLFPSDVVFKWRPLVPSTGKRRAKTPDQAPEEASGERAGVELAAEMEKLFRDSYYRSWLSSQYGPVRRWEDAALPSALQAQQIWERRFAPLWELVERPSGPESDEESGEEP